MNRKYEELDQQTSNDPSLYISIMHQRYYECIDKLLYHVLIDLQNIVTLFMFTCAHQPTSVTPDSAGPESKLSVSDHQFVWCPPHFLITPASRLEYLSGQSSEKDLHPNKMMSESGPSAYIHNVDKRQEQKLKFSICSTKITASNVDCKNVTFNFNLKCLPTVNPPTKHFSMLI